MRNEKTTWFKLQINYQVNIQAAILQVNILSTGTAKKQIGIPN